KKVQILGFKSFCDRTEVQLAGEGIAAIVGPNGCGKSNISDAITWVLGEQSAKSLRGIKMEDVIFAGTRDRKPTGMAEVSLTLVDPEVYDGATLADGEPELLLDSQSTATPAAGDDWDESAVRAQMAQETEEATLEAQPGVTYEAEGPVAKKPEGEPAAAEAAEGDPNNVVLKIRRRKFGRAPIRAGEITITRRLFRTGDSEYLLNGKICRLRDIQDIFMGTGLGGETYAIIGQERIGQILSSKPLDRRGIIEEAAGITRFKTKKRLAELRLESAKQNLSRVNDIFEEVTRQMAVLKRQAAKAERYGALRDELRGKLRVVLASRLSQIDAEQAAAATEIARLTGLVDAQAADLERMDAEHTSGVSRGYELDGQIREAGSRANSSAVELERIASRSSANAERIADLTQRIATGNDELAQARGQLETLSGELEQHRSFLENATSESTTSRETAQAQQAQAHEATRQVLAAEALAENQRRSAMGSMQRANQARNEQAQAETALAGLQQESDRLTSESSHAREELEVLGVQRGQARLSFEDVTERLKRLENEIVELRHSLEKRRVEETQSRRRGDELRAELATYMGRRGSLEALIREHSYSTDTVRNIFRANAQRSQHAGGLSPVGTLADFLEVEGQYENVVDEFLREELNYIVVKSWDAADEGMRMLQSDVAGRATFLVHPNDSQATFPFAEGMQSSARPNTLGVVPLKDCIRVLDGFGRSLEVILPKLREGFVAPDSGTARSLALSNPQAFFLAPNGETFHNVTVTGGRPREQGPLALKRELAEVQTKIEALESELSQNELATLALAREIAESTTVLDAKNHERRDAERESANSGAALRQMEAEAARIERRLQEWQLAAERNKDSRQAKQDLIARKGEEVAQYEAERESVERQVAELTEKIAELRASREELQAAASAANAALAGLEERRRNANANFEQTRRLSESQSQRIAQTENGIANAAAEMQRREEETAALATQHTELTEMRAQAIAEGETLSAEASALRATTAELDGRLRTLRHETEALREQRAQLAARSAKLISDLEHLQETCINDLSVEASALREDAAIVRIEAEALHAEDEAARALKQRLESMGPVNMMALEEYTETSERHSFLETQRKDLLDSIENTQASIKEIDEVSREKFDEAFRVINENFSVTFTKLFGGGQAHMKLTDEANSAESGIDIIASPPGKKLQNVLLLSGGEKALTALSLLVGIFQFQPAPFCVLDEVDAPLDETNVGRFARLIGEMSATTQFVVITHSKRTMEQADVMYGVTMQEPGVSKIVSVSLGGRSVPGPRAVRAA
ncbi:MAG TPA: chromosome segregation protein SMC, partial [Acidobacteriaceae bacterium]